MPVVVEVVAPVPEAVRCINISIATNTNTVISKTASRPKIRAHNSRNSTDIKKENSKTTLTDFRHRGSGPSQTIEKCIKINKFLTFCKNLTLP